MKKSYSALCLAVYIMLTAFPASAFEGVALSFEKNGAAIIIATPFVQIASTVAVERLFGGK